MPDTHGTQTPVGSTDVYVTDDSSSAVELDDWNTGYPISVMEYVLTTGDGTQYDIDQMNGLQSITDLLGNTLTYVQNGSTATRKFITTSACDPSFDQ